MSEVPRKTVGISVANQRLMHCVIHHPRSVWSATSLSRITCALSARMGMDIPHGANVLCCKVSLAHGAAVERASIALLPCLRMGIRSLGVVLTRYDCSSLCPRPTGFDRVYFPHLRKRQNGKALVDERIFLRTRASFSGGSPLLAGWHLVR